MINKFTLLNVILAIFLATVLWGYFIGKFSETTANYFFWTTVAIYCVSIAGETFEKVRSKKRD